MQRTSGLEIRKVNLLILNQILKKSAEVFTSFKAKMFNETYQLGVRKSK